MSTTPIFGAPPRAGIVPSLAGWLPPALGDLLLLAIIFWLFCAGPESWNHFLGDSNTGMHVRTGDYILNHWRVPHHDIYSSVHPGGVWFNVEWLSCLIYAALHHVWGLAGVAVLSALLLVAWPLVQLRDSVHRGANVLIALVLLFVGMRAAAIHYLARPHLFTMLFAAIAVSLIARQRERPTRGIWLLVPFAIVWTNLHGGFLALLVYVGLLVVGLFIEAAIDPAHSTEHVRQGCRWLAVFAACCAATLLNPYGIGLHIHIAEFLRARWLTQMVQEYAPAVTFLGDGYVEAFFGLLAAGAVCGLAMLARRRAVEPLWIAFFGWMAVCSARHIPLFVIVTVPLVGCELTRWLDSLATRGSARSTLHAISEMSRQLAPSLCRITPWGAAGGIAILLSGVPSEFPPGFPAGIVQRDAGLLTSSRLFTTDHWGDYLIYRLWPKQRVFIDGRSDYCAGLAVDYLTMLETEPGWQRVFAKWGFNAALVEAESHIGRALIESPSWRVADRDGSALLLVQRNVVLPHHSELRRVK